MSAFKPEDLHAEPGEYAYGFYVTPSAARTAVAVAVATAKPMLRLHQLDERGAGRSGTLSGLSIGFESIEIPAAPTKTFTAKDGTFRFPRITEGYPKPPKGAAVLVMRITVPRSLNVAAYVEALEIAIAVGKAVSAKTVFDTTLASENDWEEMREWGLYLGQKNRLQVMAGQDKRRDKLSASDNPPRVGLSGWNRQEQIGGGSGTLGLRKLGLRDLYYAPKSAPLDAHSGVSEIVGNLLAAGERPDTPTGRLVVRGSSTAMQAAHHAPKALNPKGQALVFLQPVGVNGQRRLQILLDPAIAPTDFEREALWGMDLNTAPPGFGYAPGMNEGEVINIIRGRARAQETVATLGPQHEQLRAQRTRVFVATWSIKGPQEDWSRIWKEVVKWDEYYSFLGRRWSGDPRKDGFPMKVWEGIRRFIENEPGFSEYQESDLMLQDVQDVLVLHADGRSEGGEIVEALRVHIARQPVAPVAPIGEKTQSTAAADACKAQIVEIMANIAAHGPYELKTTTTTLAAELGQPLKQVSKRSSAANMVPPDREHLRLVEDGHQYEEIRIGKETWVRDGKTPWKPGDVRRGQMASFSVMIELSRRANS